MMMNHELDPEDIRTRLFRGPWTEKLCLDAACQINTLIDAVASCREECEGAVRDLGVDRLSPARIAEVANRLRATAEYCRHVVGEEKPI